MTVAAIGPNGVRYRFPDTTSFVAWFRFIQPDGMYRVLNSERCEEVPTTSPEPHVGASSEPFRLRSVG